MIEMETVKEEHNKEKLTNKILHEEKDMNNKEFERLLEKYDRYCNSDLLMFLLYSDFRVKISSLIVRASRS